MNLGSQKKWLKPAKTSFPLGLAKPSRLGNWLVCLTIWMRLTGFAGEISHIPLEAGTLHIPDGLQIHRGKLDLLIHLHGATETVERNVLAYRKDMPWVTINLPGLSSVYSKHFRDPAKWGQLVQEVIQALQWNLKQESLAVEACILSSFSAGFGGVRELLKQSKAIDDIDTLVMIDSLYAGWVGDPSLRSVNPQQMAPFVAFARLAMTGKKRMLLTHTRLVTPDYASTAETAAYLGEQLQLNWSEEAVEWMPGMIEWRRARKAQFMALDFGGSTGQDHLNQLRHMSIFLNALVDLSRP